MIVGLRGRGQRSAATAIFRLSCLETFEDELGFNDIFTVSLNSLAYKRLTLMPLAQLGRERNCTFVYLELNVSPQQQ